MSKLRAIPLYLTPTNLIPYLCVLGKGNTAYLVLLLEYAKQAKGVERVYLVTAKLIQTGGKTIKYCPGQEFNFSFFFTI